MTVISLILLLVVIPAGVGYCLYTEYVPHGSGLITLRILRGLFSARMAPGDFVIYRKSKASNHPGPRARNVEASPNGDDYYYDVDKYWTLANILDDGRLVAQTRTGKHILITPSDERLRRAGFVERLRFRSRFP